MTPDERFEADEKDRLLDTVAELRQQLAELLDWQQKAFAAHPNIDIDIDRINGGSEMNYRISGITCVMRHDVV